MTGPESSGPRHAHRASVIVTPEETEGAASETPPALGLDWARQHQVLLGGLVIIAAQLIWKAQDLRHLFFYQDDYVNLDRAIESPFSWHYLTFVSSGHLYPGLRAVAWVLARISLYDWGLDTTVLLVLLALASLAALRLLRSLFGDRPAILIPLGIYLLTPLTVPDLGWWWAGMESVPLQLALFLALHAHLQHVRTGKIRHLVAAAIWLVFGLAFYEKAVVLPLLLFAVTSAFLIGTKSWLAGAANALLRYWKAWLTYAIIVAAYSVIFVEALAASATTPVPPSAQTALSFAWKLVRTSLFPGAIGGPWQWFPLHGGLYAIASPPVIAQWLAIAIGVLVIITSVALRVRSWRAWAILAGWIILADMTPVVLGRLSFGLAGLFGLETRYLADAACVLAVCAGLAFLPVTGVRSSALAGATRRKLPFGAMQLRYAAAGLIGVFVFGSILSVQAYEKATPGGPAARSYFTNAEQAARKAGRGTNVVDNDVPPTLVTGIFLKNALASKVIGDTAPGKLRWLASPNGTYDDLQIFGPDGKLYPAVVSGVASVHRAQPGFKSCWPERNGEIHVRFTQPTSIFDGVLKISYIWGVAPTSLFVHYNKTEEVLQVRHGVHAGYLRVSGSVKGFTVSGMTTGQLCLATATAGQFEPFVPF